MGKNSDILSTVETAMQAINVRDRDAGVGGLSLTEIPYLHAAENDVVGGDILDRSAALVRAGGTLVAIAQPPTVQPEDGRAVFFVVEPGRARLADLAHRIRDGRLKPIVGATRALPEAPAAFAPDRRAPGKTIIQVTGG